MDDQSLKERVNQLEAKVQEQDEELIFLRSCLDKIHEYKNQVYVSKVKEQDKELSYLKTTVTDLLNRLKELEKTTVSVTPIQIMKRENSNISINNFSNNNNNNYKNNNEKALIMNNNKNNSYSNFRKPSTPTENNKNTLPQITRKSSVVAAKSTKSKDLEKNISFQFTKENNVVRMFLRGRPITFFMPDISTYDIDLRIKAPQEQLKLEWVYGYRGIDCRANLYQLPNGEVIYFMAAVVVLYNINEKTQRHYIGHTDDIKSLAIHPDGVTIATGQVAGHDIYAGKPHIRVWDSVSLNTIQIIGLNLTGTDAIRNSVCCLSFSKADGGQHLCAVDDGPEKVLFVFNWKSNAVITSTKSFGDSVFCVEFHPTEKNLILTCGKSHMFFWKYDNRLLKKRTGVFDLTIKKPGYVQCISFLTNGDLVTGDSDGNIMIWDRNNAKVINVIQNAHERGTTVKNDQRGVLSIYVPLNSSSVYFISGGSDGKIIEWDMNLSKTGNEVKLPDLYGGCRSISILKDNNYIVGTTKNSILVGNFESNFKSITDGHFDELWGLAINPNDSSFFTCGNDRRLCYWDLKTHSLIWAIQLENDQSQLPKTSSTFLPNPNGVHCADFHPLKNIVAVGHTTNKWSVYNSKTQECIFTQNDGNEQIEFIKYSPNGEYLAFGSRDNIIYIYVSEDGNNYTKKGCCIGHSSFITQLDWSIDNKYIMSNSGDYEILYWEVETCKQIINISELIRNVEWATNNCILTPYSFGIWNAVNIDTTKQENNSQQLVTMDGTDINSVCLSNSKLLLASGDDYGKVNIYSYPCNTNKCGKKSYGGHSSHVTNIKFSNDNKRILSTGGKDMSIFEWSILSE